VLRQDDIVSIKETLAGGKNGFIGKQWHRGWYGNDISQDFILGANHQNFEREI
jgi:hypothetical protein